MIVFYQQLIQYLLPYKSRFILGIFFGILAGLIEPILMVCVRLVFEIIFPTAEVDIIKSLHNLPPPLANGIGSLIKIVGSVFEQRTEWMILCVSLSVPLVMMLRGLLGYLNVYLLQWVSIRAVSDLRQRLFERLIQKPLFAMQRLHSGELISRLISDTATIQRAILDSTSYLVRDPIKIISLSLFLLYTQPILTFVAVALMPLCAIPISIFNRKVRRSSKALQDEYASLSHIAHESFTGLPIIKAYLLEKSMIAKFQAINSQFVRHYMRIIKSRELPGPLLETVGTLGIAILLIYIGLAHSKPMSPGEFLQFIGSLFLMYQPIKNLTRFHQTMIQAYASSQRVFHLLLEEVTETELNSKAQPFDASGKDIVFENVCFSYNGKQVLHNISFRIPSGQMVAIVGHSGAGKSTIAHLLLKFFEPDQGRILIGQYDLKELSPSQIRSQIGVVTQEPVLFDETIEYNIRIGKPEATEQEIIQAAKMAKAHDFIMQKPHQYKTRVGEKGITLSGGERQRIAIARAILKNAPILILDEATSSLDSESERLIQEALQELMKGKTTLCIAHRLSTIQNATMIVVLEAGQIVEIGTHDELIKQNGLYKKLFELQQFSNTPQ